MMGNVRRAIVRGPDAFPPSEGHGTVAWLVGMLCWWKLWTISFLFIATVEVAYRAVGELSQFRGALSVLLLGFAFWEILDRLEPDRPEEQ